MHKNYITRWFFMVFVLKFDHSNETKKQNSYFCFQHTRFLRICLRCFVTRIENNFEIFGICFWYSPGSKNRHFTLWQLCYWSLSLHFFLYEIANYIIQVRVAVFVPTFFCLTNKTLGWLKNKLSLIDGCCGKMHKIIIK